MLNTKSMGYPPNNITSRRCLPQEKLSTQKCQKTRTHRLESIPKFYFIMKSSFTLIQVLSLSYYGLATPIEKRQDFNDIQYPPGTGENLHEYPPGTGGNLPAYPPGTGENLGLYPPGTGENLPFYPNTGAPNPIFDFSSTYHIVATPDQVVNGTDNPVFTGGLAGVQGFYDFGINAEQDLICYNIKLVGFKGEYQSLAKTATHVHQGAKGKNGPPRLAFPNPQGDGDTRYSFGCLQGLFYRMRDHRWMRG